ncbi:IS630 family transposase [Methylorubrum extorquens]
MHNLVQGSYSQKDLRTDVGEINDLRTLYDQMRRGTPINRKKAAAIISHAKGIVDTTAYEFLNLSKATFKKTVTDYQKNDISGIFKKRQSRFRKSEDENIKQEVFRVLHQPPSEYGFNRTTWKMADFREALKRNGHVISGEVIRKIAKNAGFRWSKAKVVLTSSDQEYSEKLARITRILESLGDDEAFSSIDEFGPLAVKIIGGKVLSAPGKVPTLPQGQRSKGTIIITAALELSSNQITHFYSDRKNTSEMIALMKKLANEYQGKKRIYLSWDAASWHISKQLFSAISEHNAASLGKLPIVETAPLPASAQFLNVIESVFSGMARAVLHSSNYAPVECAKAAIDRHFRERNDYFRQNSKRAGKKIWGQERVPSIFSEGANCKAAEYCWGAS